MANPAPKLAPFKIECDALFANPQTTHKVKPGQEVHWYSNKGEKYKVWFTKKEGSPFNANGTDIVEIPVPHGDKGGPTKRTGNFPYYIELLATHEKKDPNLDIQP